MITRKICGGHSISRWCGDATAATTEQAILQDIRIGMQKKWECYTEVAVDSLVKRSFAPLNGAGHKQFLALRLRFAPPNKAMKLTAFGGSLWPAPLGRFPQTHPLAK